MRDTGAMRETGPVQSQADAPTTVTARPHRLRVVAWVCAVAILAVFSLVATALTGPTEGGGSFARGDQLAMVGLGVLIAAGVLLFARPRVWADSRGVRIRNVFASYELPWEVVRGVRFDDSSPWAALDLQDDDTVALMAIQRSDHAQSLLAIRGLRALHAEHRRSTAE
ncbi:MAG: hypothetical protein JWN54_1612 [Mycobacterium sp.]|nr:hypothetical protein [Mycobacterium sp.]